MGSVAPALSTCVTLKIPAKLNLYLHAGVLRDDGYHDITMVYQAISLYDTLTISPPRDTSQDFTMTITGIDSDRIPSDSRNLVIKAARLIASYAGVPDPHLHFGLVKSIPTEAGLGGGSANAAAALVGCNYLWNTGLDERQLAAMGAQLGEDVPFFIRGLVAIGTGYHRPVVPVEVDPRYVRAWHWVLGIMPIGLSTKLVFDKSDEVFRRMGVEQLTAARAVSGLERQLAKCAQIPWGSAPPRLLVANLGNNLESTAMELAPEVGVALQAGRTAGAMASIMAGTGTTCLYLARDEAHAKQLAIDLEERKIFRQVVLAVGPVEGVQVDSEV
ncbi:hypothetical protein BBP40_011957 [Aspergillus hancockii]|nr:hypothetical protein BBP40_011957 [Aspergillus hancockii]